MGFIDVDLNENSMNKKENNSVSISNNKRESWPDVARPIIILASLGTNANYVSDLTITLIDLLDKWNSKKKSFQNKVRLMISIIGYSSVSINVYRNRKKEVRTFALPGSDVSLMLPIVEQQLNEITDKFSDYRDKVVFDLQDLNKQKLIGELRGLAFPSFIKKTYVEKLSSVIKSTEQIINFCSDQRTWLTPCVVLISDGSVMYSTREHLDEWKKSFGQIRLYSLEPDNYSDNSMIFSKDDVEDLARAIVQYIGYVEVPRVKKKSVGDCFAIQLPVLEGAIYDND